MTDKPSEYWLMADEAAEILQRQIEASCHQLERGGISPEIRELIRENIAVYEKRIRMYRYFQGLMK